MRLINKISTLAVIGWFSAVGAEAIAFSAKSSLSCLEKQNEYARLVEVKDLGSEYKVMWPTRLKQAALKTSQQLEWGGLFEVGRCLPNGEWLSLGKSSIDLKSGQLVGGQVEKVTKSEGTSSNHMFAWYQQPMVGDLVVPLEMQVLHQHFITPVEHLATSMLFQSEGQGNWAFDFSEEGLFRLKQALSKFERYLERINMIQIEVTSPRSSLSRSESRIVSQMRADTIARYLRGELKVNPRRVRAIGFGQDTRELGLTSVDTWEDMLVNDSDELITIRLMSK